VFIKECVKLENYSFRMYWLYVTMHCMIAIWTLFFSITRMLYWSGNFWLFLCFLGNPLDFY